MDVLRAFASSRDQASDPAPSRMRPMLRAAESHAPAQVEAPRAPEAFVAAPSYRAPAYASAAPSSGASNAEEPLLSPLVTASVTSAFEALTVSMAAQNTSIVEDAVRDMLRPMLKQWLDDNLPTIVERLVRTEIERVARGGRS
ncbi:MAG: DUF2497 domain-containing protein [Beijerinckiaceae bacterium]|nr:DUF2497 domain-containing protein [Beijerinckiaceae bacterium]